MNQDVELLLRLLKVPGPSAGEREINQTIRTILKEYGVPDGCVSSDDAHLQSEYGGDTGNLIVRLDGKVPGTRRMFSSHMDTVPECVGCRPVVQDDRIVNEAPDRALGGDARTGCACLLAAIRSLMALEGRHPPCVFVFFVQEERGLVGARGLKAESLGEPLPAMCFNFDSNDLDKIDRAVTGAKRMNIHLRGVAAHASAPEQGISTAIIQAEALAELQRMGWHGCIEQAEGKGTANLGVLKGGAGSNVTMPELYALMEARSFDAAFLERILETWQRVFRESVNRANTRGASVKGKAEVSFSWGPAYEPYRIDDDAPVLRTAVKVLRRLGIEPHMHDDLGGQDSSHIVALGIPAIGIGEGMREVHTVREWIDLNVFKQACRFTCELCTEEIG